MIDFDLNNDSVIVSDDVSLILQQVDLLFDTKPKEVLNANDFGTQYEKYLYRLNISNESLKHIILSDIKSLELFGFEPDVNVHLLQGTEQDIALVEINLTRDDENYQKIYKIS